MNRLRTISFAALILICALLAACGQASPVAGFPTDATHPQPVTRTFNGCPPTGDGGDTQLNTRKNRIDDGDNGHYFDVDFATLVALPFPQSVGRVQRGNWSPTDAAAVAQYEGVPVRTTGYILGVKHEGTESTNCHSTDDRDYHVWLGANTNDDRSLSMVIEITPRMQAQRRGWTSDALTNLKGQQVRISGWLLMDQEHPEQIGQTRATLWEIHPITHIELKNISGWSSMD